MRLSPLFVKLTKNETLAYKLRKQYNRRTTLRPFIKIAVFLSARSSIFIGSAVFILHSLIFFRKRQDFCENVCLFRIGAVLLPRLHVSRIASLFMTADAQSLTLFHFFRRAETNPASGTSLRFRSFCIPFFTADSSYSRVGRFIAEPTPPPRFRLFPVCRAVSVPLPKDLSLPATAALKSCTFFIRRPPRLSVVCRCRASYHAVRPASLSLPLSYSPLPALGYFSSCHTKSPLRQPLRCRKGDFSVCLLLSGLCAPAQQYATQD